VMVNTTFELIYSFLHPARPSLSTPHLVSPDHICLRISLSPKLDGELLYIGHCFVALRHNAAPIDFIADNHPVTVPLVAHLFKQILNIN
jgi:hypothetical protein